MPRRRSIKSALRGFLGTFTSRYADCEGYWLFGFVVGDLDRLEIDLLAPSNHGQGPIGVLSRTACAKFAEQAAIARVESWVANASLVIEKSSEPTSIIHNGQSRPGYDLVCTAKVTTDLGREYTDTVSIFVAPHDPAIESRSARTQA